MAKNKDEATKLEAPIDENAGKRGVYVQFDEKRLLRLDLDSMEWIENNVFTAIALPIRTIIDNIGRIGFTRVVLRGALGVKNENGILKPIFTSEQITEFINKYITDTGDLEDLQKALTDAYEMATKNPTKSAKAKAEAKEKKLEDPGGSKSST
jgi:hypothetical protein